GPGSTCRPRRVGCAEGAAPTRGRPPRQCPTKPVRPKPRERARARRKIRTLRRRRAGQDRAPALPASRGASYPPVRTRVHALGHTRSLREDSPFDIVITGKAVVLVFHRRDTRTWSDANWLGRAAGFCWGMGALGPADPLAWTTSGGHSDRE